MGFVFTQHTRGLTASILNYCHGIACSMCVLSWDCFSLNTLVVWLLWYNYCHEIACSMCVLSRDFFSLHKLAVWLLWYNCHGIAYISLTKLTKLVIWLLGRIVMGLNVGLFHSPNSWSDFKDVLTWDCILLTTLVIWLLLLGCVVMGLYFTHQIRRDLTARMCCHGG